MHPDLHFAFPVATTDKVKRHPGPTGANARRLMETWATTVEIVFTLHRYRNVFNQSDYEYEGIDGFTNSGNLQIQTITEENFYTSAGYDMLDSFNQRDRHNNNLIPIDRVEGYTINQLENALNGATAWHIWKDISY